MTNFIVYTLDGEVVGKYTEDSFRKLVRESFDHLEESNALVVSSHSIHNALLGDKGYGYCAGYFISYRPVKIYDLNGQRQFTDRYLSLAYNKLKRYFSSTKEWDEDVFQDTILYIYDKMNQKRGINNLEKTFKFKYFRTLIDNGRKEAKKFIFPDFDIVDEEGNTTSYVETAVESATLDGIEDSCLTQVNEIKLIEIAKDFLYSNFKDCDVDMYLDYVENFKNVRSSDGNGGIAGVAKKYSVSQSTVKNRIRDFKKYLKDKKEDIIEQYNDEFYPDCDNITLKHIIHH